MLCFNSGMCFINHSPLHLFVYLLASSGTFKLTLQFSEDYPNKPPTVRFVSRMFHPNSKLELKHNKYIVHISASSAVYYWSACLFIFLFFLSLECLLNVANCCQQLASYHIWKWSCTGSLLFYFCELYLTLGQCYTWLSLHMLVSSSPSRVFELSTVFCQAFSLAPWACLVNQFNSLNRYMNSSNVISKCVSEMRIQYKLDGEKQKPCGWTDKWS